MMTIESPERWLVELDEAALASRYMQALSHDPVIVAAIRRSNRANHLHWAGGNISHPGEPVPANLAAEPVAAVRHVVHRGLDESAVLDAYRLGQNAAWRLWMRTVFRLGAEPDDLHELLDVSARSLTSFLDATAAAVCEQVRTEQNHFAAGSHAERRAVVVRILDGVQVRCQDAEARLGYRFGQPHTAAVIWAEETATSLADLDQATDALARVMQGGRPLSVLADSSTRWVWLPGAKPPDPADIIAAVSDLAAVRIAVGTTLSGIDGFRRSHLDALVTQRMMARTDLGDRVANFADIELATLVTSDLDSVNRFIKRVLGDLASADEELRHTVLTFIGAQCSASRAAARLFIHRNTLLRRISHAEALLPVSLDDASVQVAVALEALRWRATKT